MLRNRLLLDYGYSLMDRVKFKPRYRQPFSRLQPMTKQLAYDEAMNQGLRIELSLQRLKLQPRALI